MPLLEGVYDVGTDDEVHLTVIFHFIIEMADCIAGIADAFPLSFPVRDHHKEVILRIKVCVVDYGKGQHLHPRVKVCSLTFPFEGGSIGRNHI